MHFYMKKNKKQNKKQYKTKQRNPVGLYNTYRELLPEKWIVKRSQVMNYKVFRRNTLYHLKQYQ